MSNNNNQECEKLVRSCGTYSQSVSRMLEQIITRRLFNSWKNCRIRYRFLQFLLFFVHCIVFFVISSFKLCIGFSLFFTRLSLFFVLIVWLKKFNRIRKIYTNVLRMITICIGTGTFQLLHSHISLLDVQKNTRNFDVLNLTEH